ncbi:MAG: AsmA family protein [Geminicoccaceae bacterium]
MTRVIAVLAVIALLAVGALLVAPSFIDWEANRERVVAELERLAGRPVKLDGDIEVVFLPRPVMRLSDAAVGGRPDDTLFQFLSLDALELELAAQPLFSGRIVISHARLSGVDIHLRKPEDGQPLALRAASALRQGSSNRVRVEGLELEDVRIIAYDADGSPDAPLGPFDAMVSIDSLRGPFTLDLRTRLADLPLALNAQIGRIDPQGYASLQAEVQRETANRLSYRGLVRIDEHEPRLQGAATLDLADMATLRPILEGVDARALSAPLSQPLSVAGDIEVTPGAFRLQGGSLASGDTTGMLAVDWGLGGEDRLDAELALSTLAITRADLTGIDLASLIDALAGHLPSRGNAAITVDALDLAGVSLRRARAAMAFNADGSLGIDELRTSLPGGGRLELENARIALAGGPQVTGDVYVVTNDLRAVLEPVVGPLGDLQETALRRLDLRAGLRLSPTALELSDLQGQLDRASLSGALALDHAEPRRLSARLDIDRLDLDPYLGARRIDRALADLPSWIERLDGQLDLRIARLNTGEARADGVRLRGSKAGASITLDEAAIGDLVGAEIRATGQIDLTADTAQLSGAITSPEPARMARSLGVNVPAPLVGLDNLAVNVALSGHHARPELDINGTWAGIDGAFRGTFDRESGWHGLRGRASFMADDLASALGVAGLVPPPGSALPTAGKVDLAVSDDPDGGTRWQLDALLDSNEVLADLALLGLPSPDRITGRLELTDLQSQWLERLYAWLRPEQGRLLPAIGRPGAWSSADLPLPALQDRLIDLDLRAQSLDGLSDAHIIVLQPADTPFTTALEATFAGGKLDAALRGLPNDADNPASIVVAVRDADLSAVVHPWLASSLQGTRLDLAGDLSAHGLSPQALAQSLSGTLGIRLAGGTVEGFDLGLLNALMDVPGDSRQARVERALTGGASTHEQSQGELVFDQGVGRGSFASALANADGDGELRIDLSAGTLDMRASLTPTRTRALPPITLTVTGPLDDPVLSLDGAALAGAASALPATP